MVPTVGIEPTTFGVWIRRSSQLSYTGILESLNILLERFHLRPTRALADAWGFEPHITMRDFYCCFAGRIWTINHSDEPVSNYPYETSMLTKIGFWSEWRDLNSRPLDPKSSALPNWATPGCGADGRTRTDNLLICSTMLTRQTSYLILFLIRTLLQE